MKSRFKIAKAEQRATVAPGGFSAGVNRSRDVRQLLLNGLFVGLSLVALTAQAFAGGADVVGVEANQSGDGSWRFSVSVLHADAGWNHYADKWAVLLTDGTMVGERILLHPHDNEQPFTRSQSGIVIPDGVSEVIVRAHDSVHGWDGKEMVHQLD